MKYLLIIQFSLLPALAFAQEEGVDNISDCAAVLAAPPFLDMLTRNEGHDFSEISSPENEQKLLGIECSVDQLTEFFEDAGWEFEYFDEYKRVGTSGVTGVKFYSDSSAHYCLKRPTLFGMFDYRCRPIVRIDFDEKQISNLTAYTTK